MKKCGMSLALLPIVALIFGALACGGEKSDADIIRDTLNDEVDAINSLDLTALYEIQTPGYRTRVSFEEYGTFIEQVFGQYYREALDAGKEVELTNVNVRVEGEWGYMTGQLVLNGDVVLSYTDDSPDIWRKVGGTWYDAQENHLDPGYNPSDLP